MNFRYRNFFNFCGLAEMALPLGSLALMPKPVRARAGAIGRVEVGPRWQIVAAEGSVVACHHPESPGSRAPLGQDRHWRVVGVQPCPVTQPSSCQGRARRMAADEAAAPVA